MIFVFNTMNQYRAYDKAPARVDSLYRMLRTKQTIEYVTSMHQWYERKVPMKLNVWDALLKVGNLKDNSDPDIEVNNLHHLFQVAEAMRRDNLPEWMQVTGLIHDLGKILYLQDDDERGLSLSKQWGVVGDTFIVGCQIPDSVVYPQYNILNPDMKNSSLNSLLGVYKPHCGLSNTLCSWGHDEYLYKVLRDSSVFLPEEAFYAIRYHSLYPHHSQQAYQHLLDTTDHMYLPYLKQLNQYDLYTKSDTEIMVDQLRSYYQPLLDQYLGQNLIF
jgi:inositol oxygenase